MPFLAKRYRSRPCFRGCGFLGSFFGRARQILPDAGKPAPEGSYFFKIGEKRPAVREARDSFLPDAAIISAKSPLESDGLSVLK